MALLRVIACVCAGLAWHLNGAHAFRRDIQHSNSSAKVRKASAVKRGGCEGVAVKLHKDVYTCYGPDGEVLNVESECCQSFLQCDKEASQNLQDFRTQFGFMMKGCSLKEGEDYRREGKAARFHPSARLCSCAWEPSDEYDSFRPICFDFEKTSTKVAHAIVMVRSVHDAIEAKRRCPKICQQGEYPETCMVPFPEEDGQHAVVPPSCRGNLVVIQLPKLEDQYYVPLRVTSASPRDLDMRREKGPLTSFLRVRPPGGDPAGVDLEIIAGTGALTSLPETEKLDLGLEVPDMPSKPLDPDRAPTNEGESSYVSGHVLTDCVDQSYWTVDED